MKALFPKRAIPLIIGICITVLAVCLHQTTSPAVRTIYHRLNSLVYDLQLQAQLPYQALKNSPIVIVDVDEASLKQVGRWPWSRKVLARLVNTLMDAKAAVVGVDMLLSEKERNPALTISEASNISDALKASLKKVAPQFSYDEQLASALARGDVVLSTVMFRQAAHQHGMLGKPLQSLSPQMAAELSVPAMEGYTTSLPVFSNVVRASGFVSYFRDPDGVSRRLPLLLMHNKQLYPAFTLEVARTYLLESPATPQFEEGRGHHFVKSVKLGKYYIPTDGQGQVLMPFYGGPRTFSTVSASAVLAGHVPMARFHNKIVLIGTSAIGLTDLRATPASVVFPGVEVQAGVIQAILDHTIPFHPVWAMGTELAIIIVLGLLLSLVLPLCRPVLQVVLMLLVVVGLLVFSTVMFNQSHLVSHVAGAVVMTLVLSAGYLLYGLLFATRARRQLKMAFSQYIPKQHIDEIEEDPETFSFEGDNREMSVLFCDIRNFTGISESLSARELKELLNKFFTPMTKIIFDNGGTIDKYVGDMIMAFWGAPRPNACHAKDAINAGMQMLKAVEAFDGIDVGIGINSGEMNVGDMGSTYRRSYTVLGDNVNLASRLESATKQYDLKILVSEYTAKDQPDWVFRMVDKVRVKGKDKSVILFEPIGKVGTLSEEKEAELKAFSSAQFHYFEKQWLDALAGMQACQKKYPCKLYDVYVDRIVHFMQSPPAIDWDGSVALPK